MVVVREDCPGLDFPAELGECFEKPVFEEVSFLGGVEEMLFVERSGGDEVSAGVVYNARWGVGPRAHGGLLP